MVIEDGVLKNLPETGAHFHQNLSQWQAIKIFSLIPKDYKESLWVLLIIIFGINI